MQGTTPSPYEAAAQLKKKRDTEGVGNGQDWRWEVNKRQKVHSLPPFHLHLQSVMLQLICLAGGCRYAKSWCAQVV